MADGNVPAKRPRSAWSDAEVDALRRLYSTAPRAETRAALPLRSWGAIIRMANTLGVPSGDLWTPAEDALVIEHTVQKRGNRRRKIDWTATLAALPRRTRGAIAMRRRALGLNLTAGGRRWSAEEDAVILNDFAEDGRRTLLDKLPGRTWHAISTRATRLGFPPMPQGWEPLSVASKRILYEPCTARRIIAWSAEWAPLVAALCAWGHAVAVATGVVRPAKSADGKRERKAVDAYETGAVATRKHTTCSTPARVRSDTRTDGCWTLVESGALDLAAARWLAWETSGDAARRTGLRSEVVRAALVRERYLPANAPCFVRVPPAWTDDAVASRPPRGMTLAAQAKWRARKVTR